MSNSTSDGSSKDDDDSNSPPGDSSSPPSSSPLNSSSSDNFSSSFFDDTSSPPPSKSSSPASSSPPPSGGDDDSSSPPDSSSPSKDAPPPSNDDVNSSPPPSPSSNSKSPPPSDDSDYSPPPESGSSSAPPLSDDSDSSPPPPPKSSSSPPLPKGDSSSSSKSPPPPPPKQSSPPPFDPPTSSDEPSPSPPPPPPPISNDVPPPSEGSVLLPPPASTEYPPVAYSPPEVSKEPTPSSRNNLSPSSEHRTPSETSHHSPKLIPPSKESDSENSSPTTPDSSGGSNNTATIAGATIAGIVIIGLIAIIFMVSRKKKRRVQGYPPHYAPPPDSFTVRTDGYYYGPPQTTGVPGNSQEYYSGPPPHMSFAAQNNYGSNRGNMFNAGGADTSGLGGSQSCFSYEQLMEITNGFARENILGEGGFGAVHKGWLPDGRIVAVKQLKVGSGQGEREFRAEVEIISRVHHRHLVSLVGYCIADNHRLLVYEFVPNKTLEHHLHGEGLPVMEWSKRLRIAIGSARGLAYLHEDCHPKIIHRDIKSANILVDDAFEAQVADFGLAKLSTDTYTHVSTRVMGTFGYMAPEYASSGKLTDRSDVFSFGVVLLEIVTGRKPVDPTQPIGDESLVEWARPLLIHALETGDVSELIDPRLEKRYVESEMFRMIEAAAACIRHSAPKRPRMVQVLRSLDCEGDMQDLSNGVKYGQSTVYDSREYSSELTKFRKMAFSEDSSEYDMYSGEYYLKVAPQSSGEFQSGESETRAINPHASHRF